MNRRSQRVAASASHRQVEALVIGGSAGSLDVLRKILRALPAKVNLPVVVVLHLAPNGGDGLAELLGLDCALPVKQAEDKEPLAADVVYIAPPGYHLLIESHRAFALSMDDPVHYSRPSIDVTFECAADAYGSHLLAVLLSGASHDGAAGMQEVSIAQGVTVVQAPASAESPVMPAAALALFDATFVWTPLEMARELPCLLPGARPGQQRSPA